MFTYKHKVLLALIPFLSASLACPPGWGARAQHSSPSSSAEDKMAAEVDFDVPITGVHSSLEALMTANSLAWSAIPATTIPLFQQDNLSPHGGGSTKELSFRAVHIDSGVVFRVEWVDNTKDDGSKTQFKDALAIQFPVDSSGDTRLAMGHSGGPVNILYWCASGTKNKRGVYRPAEEMVAAGIHNRASKPAHLQQLKATSEWRGGKWTVIIFKPFNHKDPASPSFERGNHVPVAFAVWNGHAGERLGLKSVSNWNALVCK